MIEILLVIIIFILCPSLLVLVLAGIEWLVKVLVFIVIAITAVYFSPELLKFFVSILALIWAALTGIANLVSFPNSGLVPHVFLIGMVIALRYHFKYGP